jgi:4-hydroxybenzoate polyprenyltransferase
MKYSNILWEEFIYGGHWLSIGASAIALSVIYLLNISIKWEFLLISYLGTQCIYNYNHFKELKLDMLTNSNRSKHLQKYQKYGKIIISIYGICYIIVLFLYGNNSIILFGSFLLFLGLFFSVAIKQLFKKIIGFKLIYTALSWALLILFVAIYHSYEINSTIMLFFIFAFFRVIITTIFFDIKDIKLDKNVGLTTLPVILGREKSIDLLQIINLISILPIIIGIILKLLPTYSFFLIFLFFYSFFYIQKSRNVDVDISNLSYVMVDGEFYYWPFLLAIGIAIM